MVFSIAPSRPLDVEAKMHDIAFAHDVLLALEAQAPRLARAGFAAIVDVILERDDLGANEAAFEISVDHAGGLRRGAARAHRPGADFFRPGGEIGQQSKQLIGTADHAVQTRLLESQVAQEFGAFGLRQLCDLRLDRGTYRHYYGMLHLRARAQGV